MPDSSVNETEPDIYWSWNARSGRYPDQYQTDRMLEINPNPPQVPPAVLPASPLSSGLNCEH